MLFEILESSEETEPANNPKINVRTASEAMPALNMKEDSFACFAFSLRGRARKVMPNAFTKQAAARPPVKIKEPVAIINTNCVKKLNDLILP